MCFHAVRVAKPYLPKLRGAFGRPFYFPVIFKSAARLSPGHPGSRIMRCSRLTSQVLDQSVDFVPESRRGMQGL